MSTFSKYFEQNGYTVIDLLYPQRIFDIRQALLRKLREATSNSEITLEKYHGHMIDDEKHTQIQIALTDFIRSDDLIQKVVLDNTALFEQLIGPDMNIQAQPYLRITRPGKSKDNIGYHRDTFYGGSPYEISVVIPFVELDTGNALRVQPKSHLIPEKSIPLIQTKSEDVEKGSAKHKLGFLYAPKIIDPSYHLDMQPVPLQLGQVLAFSLATLHGTIGNDSTNTRWSVDMRIVARHAPVDLSLRPTYYNQYLASPATALSDAYEKVNKTEPTTPSNSPLVRGRTDEEKKWLGFKEQLGDESVTFGPYFAFQLRHTPRHVLYSLAYHKFAAKMIGEKKDILDIGCSEGLGTMLLAEFANYVLGVDIDEAAIESAKKNFAREHVEFQIIDLLKTNINKTFDAAVSFDVIEHIYPEHAAAFIDAYANHLNPEGVAIIGTPNITSNQYANARTQSGHVNLYSAERLREEVGRRFKNVFMFSVNDEVIHTGFSPMAHYLIAMGVGVKPQ
ncbi:MAG TPA: methyltransferase domain-containing protein [Candidatus Andersenbacteria bacterium]|nr:methyltransferase domain-containing protein [Candidatus Andersenbacteria bacterium]